MWLRIKWVGLRVQWICWGDEYAIYFALAAQLRLVANSFTQAVVAQHFALRSVYLPVFNR